MRYYTLLKKAFESGKIDEIEFYLFLQRNFVFKNKEMLGIENDDNYTFAEKILILQDSLGYKN